MYLKYPMLSNKYVAPIAISNITASSSQPKRMQERAFQAKQTACTKGPEEKERLDC